MSRIATIADELTNNPLARSYSTMTDAQVVTDMNALRYDGPADPGALFNYLVTNKARDQSSETATIILGRLERVHEAGRAVAEASGVASQVFGDDQAFSNLTPQGLDACRAFLEIAKRDSLQAVAELTTTEVSLSDMMSLVVNTGVMKPADRNAILALSQNKQSRAQVLGLGRVRLGEVEQARAR